MNTEMINIGIGFCFAAIIILFLFLLTKDSEFFHKETGSYKRKGKKKEENLKHKGKAEAFKGAAHKAGKPVEKFINNNKGIAPELPVKAKIYYRLPDKKSYKEVSVKNVPFKIGAMGSGADLELDDLSVLDKHAVLNLVDTKQGCVYAFKNFAKKIYTDYLDQEGEQPEWVKVEKNDKVYLKNSREAFYVGNTKLLIDTVSLERSVSKSDVDLFQSAAETGKYEEDKNLNSAGDMPEPEEQTYDRTRRTPSDRVFEENVLDMDDICC